MYQLKLEKFEGPLDLLLGLIEDQQLDISQVSLAEVADQYLKFLENNQEISPEELADFLVVATKLLLIKSKLLIPDLQIDDEDDPENFANQLKIYREYLKAMSQIIQLISLKRFLFWRDKSPLSLKPQFSPGKNLTSSGMVEVFSEILKELEKLVVLPVSIMEKTVSLQEKISQIKNLFNAKSRELKFEDLMNSAKSRTEVIISFLAILELMKQQEVHLHQEKNFGDIYIKAI